MTHHKADRGATRNERGIDGAELESKKGHLGIESVQFPREHYKRTSSSSSEANGCGSARVKPVNGESIEKADLLSDGRVSQPISDHVQQRRVFMPVEGRC